MQNTFLVIIIMLFTYQPPKAETFEAVTVLELFTSQGCSSCPSADGLLGNVKNNDNVIALSYHVDYWNYIGWNDPFSNKYNTEKQREYGQKFYKNRIYTPQLVINGKEHFVGSNAKILNSKLKTYGTQLAENKIDITNVKRIGSSVSIDYEANGTLSNKHLRFALVIDERITNVKRGENRNRTIKNENIVVSEIVQNTINEKGNASLKIPELVNKNDVLKVVAIIQTNTLDITGATQKTL